MEPPPPRQRYPFVTVVVPVYNEERHINDCLRSVLEQDFPSDRYEVIVADGGSSDRTRDLVEAIGTQHPRLRLIDNPGRTQAAGLNRAILASRGEFIARQDGHAEWTRHHLRRSVELLLEAGVDNVGGRQDPTGRSVTGRAIACAMRSRFGVGGARFHYSERLEEVPTVFLGTFRRGALERVGLFDEAYPPHEDYELNHRIRSSGGRVLYSPEIRTLYHVRESIPTLARQYFLYGRAKVRVARSAIGVIRPYHVVAPAMVAAVPAMAAACLTRGGRRLAAAGATAYIAASVTAAFRASRGEDAAVRVRVPTVFAVMHLAWGLGFWAGVGEAVMRTPTGGGAPPGLPVVAPDDPSPTG